MKNYKNLIVRAISGAILVALLLSGILLSDISSFLVLSLIAVGGVYELLSLIGKNSDVKPNRLFATAVAVAISVSLYLKVEVSTIMELSSILFLARCCSLIFAKELRNPIKAIGSEIFALLYALLPMMMLQQLNGHSIVALLFMVWCNDVGAYIVGVNFGRRKLCERLSPKKSWEGYFGGVVATIIVANIFAYFGDISYLSATIIGIIISNAAVVGDLFESMIKRTLGVKDSGNVIPGHGGVLDRFDALYFAAPIFYMLYIYII